MPEPTVTLTLRFDPDLYARAKAQARAEGMSLNQWMQQAAEEKLAVDSMLENFDGVTGADAPLTKQQVQRAVEQANQDRGDQAVTT